MLNIKEFKKIYLAFFLCLSCVSYQAVAMHNQYDNMSLKIVNQRHLNASMLPAHDFEYGIIIPNEEKSSGGPLKDKIVPGNYVDVTVYRYDENDITADLKITDPAFGGMLIWEGQIFFDKSTNQIKHITRNQNDKYIITIKLSQPVDLNPKFEMDLLSL